MQQWDSISGHRDVVPYFWLASASSNTSPMKNVFQSWELLNSELLISDFDLPKCWYSKKIKTFDVWSPSCGVLEFRVSSSQAVPDRLRFHFHTEVSLLFARCQRKKEKKCWAWNLQNKLKATNTRISRRERFKAFYSLSMMKNIWTQ